MRYTFQVTRFKIMKILAIETSCDDTCVAILKGRNQKSEILSNIVSSQVKLHAKYGGVYPTLAKREHQKNLVLTLKKALKEAKILRKSKYQNPNVKSNLKSKCQKLEKILKREPDLLEKIRKFLEKYEKPKIDAIAVTIGPGLEPCLWIGINFAKALSYMWNLPIIPINHIEGHILANLLPQVGSNVKIQISNVKSKPKAQTQNSNQVKYPAICLIASGGHTQIILMKGLGKYKILGETRDDAAGECFDKAARILGLDYPGGPVIAQQATKYKIQDTKYKIQLPRPMIYQKNYDFSFSGLKTAVLYNHKSQSPKTRKSKKYIQAMSAEIQQAIIDVLIHKTMKAAKDYKAKTILLGGGVTANKKLRSQFQQKIKKEKLGFQLYVSSSKMCADNAAMIAIAAYEHWLKGEKTTWKNIEADANLRLESKNF